MNANDPGGLWFLWKLNIFSSVLAIPTKSHLLKKLQKSLKLFRSQKCLCRLQAACQDWDLQPSDYYGEEPGIIGWAPFYYALVKQPRMRKWCPSPYTVCVDGFNTPTDKCQTSEDILQFCIVLPLFFTQVCCYGGRREKIRCKWFGAGNIRHRCGKKRERGKNIRHRCAHSLGKQMYFRKQLDCN